MNQLSNIGKRSNYHFNRKNIVVEYEKQKDNLKSLKFWIKRETDEYGKLL
ncbi:MAG: hypothetical protein O2U61_07590 [Candidatus Bathyarchaeota archaeon]|nr:hypothetical protein [Candidatus Bathyarchaeota archaeon]